VLNITTHPHSPQGYVDLFRRAKRSKVVVRARGERHAIISQFAPYGSEAAEYFGTMSTFVDFDPKAPWLNVTSGKQAEPDEVAEVSLPDNLKPSLIQAFIALDPTSHRLVVESTLGTSSIIAAITGILNEERVRGTLEQVHVAVEQSREAVAAILGRPDLKRLEVYVFRPNPDDLGDEWDRDVQERLGNLNAASISEVVEGSNIVPDSQLRAYADAAASHGRVIARHGERGAITKSSTENHPVVVSHKYDQNVSTPDVGFIQLVRKAIDAVRNRRRKSGDDG
jgi:hypothetical protein